VNVADYVSILSTAAQRLAAIARQRGELEVEATKLRQFIMATINMLPDADREEFLRGFRDIEQLTAEKERGLKETILNVLRTAHPKWLTAAQVRDRLKASGFDFTGYVSEPLASVSTTLRRLKDEEVESAESEGVTAYRFNKKRFSDIARERAMGRLKDMK